MKKDMIMLIIATICFIITQFIPICLISGIYTLIMGGIALYFVYSTIKYLDK